MHPCITITVWAGRSDGFIYINGRIHMATERQIVRMFRALANRNVGPECFTWTGGTTEFEFLNVPGNRQPS